MSLEYIRAAYRVPAKVGQRIAYNPYPGYQSAAFGTVTGSDYTKIVVDFDGGATESLDPVLYITYLEDE